MTDNDNKNSELTGNKPKPDPFERYEKRMSSKLFQKIVFWGIALTILRVFFYIIDIPLSFIAGFLSGIIGDSALPYQNIISNIIFVISIVGAIVFVIWLWRMYKRHVINNEPG